MSDDSIREQLLGYLLGALDESEQESLEDQLERDPHLRRELAEMRDKLRPLEATRLELSPPPGLAFRTCELVASAAHSQTRPKPASVPLMAPVAPTVTLSNLRWPDVTVGATVCLLAVLLVLPAVHGSRFVAQVEACQDNLRKVGYALENYSQLHAGYFPTIPSQGKAAAAGIYAPTLLRSGLLTETRVVLCPAAARTDRASFAIPSLDELESASEEEVPQLQETMGGSYGYSLGYLHNGHYQGTRNLHRASFALAADTPSTQQQHQSQNHAGRGQNVLFEDGHIQFLRCTQILEGGDDIFVNDDRQVAAGLHLNDAVIAPSDARP
jgi:hypothetical protein